MIILASSSPRRFELLKECGLKFKVIPASIKENTRYKNPAKIVERLSLKKALFVGNKLKDGLVIGADTIVVLKGRIIGKPKDKKDAFRILSMLNGTYHRVYTGVAVVDAKTLKYKVGHEVSRVKMRKLSKEEINNFTGKHMDKAGAYSVQEQEDAFVEKIEGDYYNVVGLPLRKLAALLRAFKIKLTVTKKIYRPGKLS
ncbi:MAG: Maf family protein [Elusimicrobia bacterium]|nr:Maf family protein [Candidatus Liberimonas magnetica]